MFLLTRAILAIPLVVAALVALLSPKGVAANVVPHQPRMLRLYSRQVPVPEACLNICEMLVNTLDACTTIQCACTAQNMDEADQCIDCLGPTNLPDGQEVIDEQDTLQRSDWIGIEFGEACDEYGITLSVPTITASSITSGASIVTTFTGTAFSTTA